MVNGKADGGARMEEGREWVRWEDEGLRWEDGEGEEKME